MWKQKKQLIILSVVLMVAAAAYIGLKVYNNREIQEEEKDIYTVIKDSADDVTELSFTNENGSYTFVKKEGAWHCKEAESADIDNALLEEMVNSIVSLNSENKIDAVQDFAQYGLDAPGVTVSYKTPAGGKTLKIGDYSGAVSQYYMVVEGEHTVYTCISSFRSLFVKGLEDLKKANTEETEESGS